MGSTVDKIILSIKIKNHIVKVTDALIIYYIKYNYDNHISD